MRLARCTNVPRGDTWAEIFAALREHILAKRDHVGRPGEEQGIGLHLGDQGARELSAPPVLADFRRWLERERCYVFTINDLPSGPFHGAPVEEAVGRPDWADPARLAHTQRLLDLLGELLPEGVEGSVSTLPGSFKASVEPTRMEEHLRAVYANLIHAAVHAAEASGRTGWTLRLALEPEPLGLFGNTAETVRFLELLVGAFPDQFGMCFDACHFAAGFEEPAAALAALEEAGIPVVKLRLTAALRTRDNVTARERLRPLADDGYLRQVAVRRGGGQPTFHRDLNAALATTVRAGDEWRVHVYVPLHASDDETFGTTADALPDVFDWLAADPRRCSHLEIETCTWDFLSPGFHAGSVADQLAREYDWTLALLQARSLV